MLVSWASRRANDAVLVDEVGQGHGRNSELIERVDQYRPLHAMPLLKESAAIGVLLLNHPDDLQFAGLLQRLGLLVPPGHVLAAAGSPGSVDQKQRLTASKRRHGAQRPILERWEDEIGKGLAYLGRSHQWKR